MKWSVVSLVMCSIAVASLTGLAVVAGVRDADALATVALALAVLTFIAQLLATAFQVRDTAAAAVRDEQLNTETKSLLVTIQTAADDMREMMAGQFDRVLKAALSSAVPDAVAGRAGVDPVELAKDIRAEVLELMRTSEGAESGGPLRAPSSVHAPRVVQTAPTDRLVVGDRVQHGKFGLGTIREITGSGDREEAVVDFDDVGEKRLLLAWAPLSKVV